MNSYYKTILICAFCAPMFFYGSKVFAMVVAVVGRKTGFAKSFGFMCIGLTMAAIFATPFFYGLISMFESNHEDQQSILFLLLCYVGSLVPSYFYLSKNRDIFYTAGYWKK